jgi:hypothetical protein
MNVSDRIHVSVLRYENSFRATSLIHFKWCVALVQNPVSFPEKILVLGLGLNSDFWDTVESLEVLKNPMIHRLKERWKLFVLMYGLENFFWKRFENVCMKDCSVLRMNSLSKLGVRYGLLDHCTWQLDRCIMLSRLMNHSKSRDHVQVRWSFRNFQSWPVIMHWNLKTDSELKLELLVSLVWSLSFQNDKLCFWRRSSRARC